MRRAHWNRLPYRPHTWHPDNRRFLADQMTFGVQGYDTERFHRLGHFFPRIESLAPDESHPLRHWLCLGPTGHVRGGPCEIPDVVAGLPTEPKNADGTLASLADLIVYVALHEDGSQRTYSPDEFALKFNWNNDPDRGTLLKLDE